jgi:hypothetical protein
MFGRKRNGGFGRNRGGNRREILKLGRREAISSPALALSACQPKEIVQRAGSRRYFRSKERAAPSSGRARPAICAGSIRLPMDKARRISDRRFRR